MAKPSRMRARRKIPRNPLGVLLAATSLAAMLAVGHAQSPLKEALGNLLPPSDRSLAACIFEAKCAWEDLERFAEGMVKDSGFKHKLDSSQMSTARTKIDAIKTKMDKLKAAFKSQKSSLSLGSLADQKKAKRLLACLEKNICAAQARSKKLQNRFQFKSSGEGKSPRPPKPAKAGPLEKAADAGEDLLGEALGNLGKKAKTKKKARKKATKKKASRPKKTASRTDRTYDEDFEDGADRALAARDESRARARARAARLRGSQAKVEKNTYLALEAQGKVEEGNAFYFETLPLELSGEVVAQADIGLFSDKQSVRDAAGDGEQGCLELSTVGSAPADAFVSLCGRQNSGRGGFEAYMLTPQGARAVTFLAGVEVAEFRVSVQNGMVTFEVRNADVRGEWAVVDQVAKPADPMTISLGASFMATNDEIGIDNLLIEAIYAD